MMDGNMSPDTLMPFCAGSARKRKAAQPKARDAFDVDLDLAIFSSSQQIQDLHSHPGGGSSFAVGTSGNADTPGAEPAVKRARVAEPRTEPVKRSHPRTATGAEDGGRSCAGRPVGGGSALEGPSGRSKSAGRAGAGPRPATAAAGRAEAFMPLQHSRFAPAIAANPSTPVGSLARLGFCAPDAFAPGGGRGETTVLGDQAQPHAGSSIVAAPAAANPPSAAPKQAAAPTPDHAAPRSANDSAMDAPGSAARHAEGSGRKQQRPAPLSPAAWNAISPTGAVDASGTQICFFVRSEP